MSPDNHSREPSKRNPLETTDSRSTNSDDHTHAAVQRPVAWDKHAIEPIVFSDGYFRRVLLRLGIGAAITGSLVVAVLIFNARERNDEIVSTEQFGYVLNAVGQQRALLERMRVSLDTLEEPLQPPKAAQIRKRLLGELARYLELREVVSKYGTHLDPGESVFQSPESTRLYALIEEIGHQPQADPGLLARANQLMPAEHATFSATINHLMEHELRYHRSQHDLQSWMEWVGLSAMIIAVCGIVAPALLFLRRQHSLLQCQAEQLERLSMVAKCTSNAVAMTDHQLALNLVASQVSWVGDAPGPVNTPGIRKSGLHLCFSDNLSQS